MPRPKVVVVGGGFGGLNTARKLARAPVDVTLVDRTNHHLFQPLLYQVATAGLSVPEVAVPIRGIFNKQRNVKTLFGEVVSVDVDARLVKLGSGVSLPYDYLVLAAGARTDYRGNDSWEELAIGLKTATDALNVRHRILHNFELAESENHEGRRKALLTSVVIGGGATGVELAGALSELSRRVLLRDFRTLQPSMVRVVLIERADRVLGNFHPKLSKAGKRQLEELGVEVLVSTSVTGIDKQGVVLGEDRIDSGLVAWTSGVKTVPLATAVAAERDHQDRIIVGDDCAIPGHPEAFVIGDMAAFKSGDGWLPGLAPVAMQQGRYVAKLIRREMRAARNVDESGEPRRSPPSRKPFVYFDKGSMATVGRSRAVMQYRGFHWSGFIAWMAWLVVHLLFLVSFRSRILVLYEWIFAYVANRRGARIIEGPWSINGRPGEANAPLPEQKIGLTGSPPQRPLTATDWRQNGARRRPS
ncbi:MAG: NAD(P)/FAD-dependent oxidoreductase [Clostridia bacterium]|nr:NAD(P)/FAD-dependent oxidoreductase [Deltaproteobacteria bacterium]